MKPAACWSDDGEFSIVDADQGNAPMARLKLFSPLRELALEEPELVARQILEALVANPRPFGDLVAQGAST